MANMVKGADPCLEPMGYNTMLYKYDAAVSMCTAMYVMHAVCESRDARCVCLSRRWSAGKCRSPDRNKIMRLLCRFNTEPISWIGFISSRDSWTSTSVGQVRQFRLCLQVRAGYDYAGPVVVLMLKLQSLLLGQLFFTLPSCDMDGTLVREAMLSLESALKKMKETGESPVNMTRK